MNTRAAGDFRRLNAGSAAETQANLFVNLDTTFSALDEVAIAYAFALWAVGMAEKGEVSS